MFSFSAEEKGYNRTEVDNTLARLKKQYEDSLVQKQVEIDRLEKRVENFKEIVADYMRREDQTQRIMATSQNVRALEIKRLEMLFDKWEHIVQEVEDHSSPVISKDEFISLTRDFGQAFSLTATGSKYSEHDSSYAKSVLSRMSERPAVTQKASKVSPRTLKEDKSVKQQPQAEKKRPVKTEKNPSAAEMFLKGNEVNIPKSMGVGNQMFSIPPKEFLDTLKESKDGFSLEEALCPKQSLAEIMTAFELDLK